MTTHCDLTNIILKNFLLTCTNFFYYLQTYNNYTRVGFLKGIFD